MEIDSQASSKNKSADNRKIFFIGLLSLFLIIAAVTYYKTREPTLVGKWVNTSSLKDEYPDTMPNGIKMPHFETTMEFTADGYLIQRMTEDGKVGWNSTLKYIVTKPGVFEIRDDNGNTLETDTFVIENGQLYIPAEGVDIQGAIGFTKISN